MRSVRLGLALLLGFSLSACREDGRSAQEGTAAGAPVAVGETMPPYTAQTLDGASFDLADLRGTVVLVNIWATWCGPCRYEIPDLIELHRTWAPEGFQVLGVSVDGPETMSEVEPMVKARSINYPVVLDPDGVIANVFETAVIPTSALIDREGTVVWKEIGVIDASDPELLAAMREAL
ncbi:MAG TPA: TlpA disulfide reductase family protein [Thermoanaerobaculia bacterium]|nr:TlpA disulfide reductase family protein [Thermoanaerobaculia bacterium]